MEQTQDIDQKLEKLGVEVYGKTWPQVLALNVRRMTDGGGGPLTDDEKQKLIRGLMVLKGQMR